MLRNSPVQNNQLTAKCLQLIGKAAVYLQTSRQPSILSATDLALELMRAQADYESASLRALVFQTVHTLIQTPECQLGEEGLNVFLNLFFRALDSALTAEPAASKFSLQVGADR